MSKLRSVNTHFWQDNYIADLDPIEKLLFLYLLTNPQTNMLGIYELNIRRISFDTGIDKDMILKIFDRFTTANKATYKDGYVILQNFIKHQAYNNNMETSAQKSWKDLPLEIRNDRFCEPIRKGLESFTKGSEPIAESEYESERELESEGEAESKKRKPLPSPNQAPTKPLSVATQELPRTALEYETHHEKMSNFAKQYGAMDGLTPREIEHYIVKRGSDDWEKPQGNIIKRITQTNIRADMLYMKRQGWLREPKAEETENTFNGGVMN